MQQINDMIQSIKTLYSQGFSNVEIAAILNIDSEVVRRHIQQMQDDVSVDDSFDDY